MISPEIPKEGEAVKPDPILQSLIEQANRESDVITLWLYGSRARGDHHPESDYDLAVLFNSRLSDRFEARVRPEVKALEWAETLKLGKHDQRGRHGHLPDTPRY